ncbi:hypothetical protein ACFVW9_22635 [Streptomyces sp. NPDC058217]|uniref:hypothetical protein n=1 Tax=Streptomyces sp. NPDC058217 TaxID=3346384 RepID=UPI0036E8C35F
MLSAGPVCERIAVQCDSLVLGDALLVQHRPGPAAVRLQRGPLPLLALLPVVGPLLLLFGLLLLLLMLFGLLGGADCCWGVGGQPRQRGRD